MQAERDLQVSRAQIDAGVLAQKSLEEQNVMLRQENAAFERNVIALRGLVLEKHLVPDACHSSAGSGSSLHRDLALIAHLEGRAKESEQRAECMMFQRNEAQSR